MVTVDDLSLFQSESINPNMLMNELMNVIEMTRVK